MKRTIGGNGRRKMATSCCVAAGLAMIGLAGLTALPERAAAENGRITIIEENDGLLPSGTDRHYTQGALLTYLSPKLAVDDATAGLYAALSNLPIMQPGVDVQRRFDVVFGQSIFTPTKYHQAVPDPTDRPFAGWLYTGGSLLQETHGNMLENFEVLAGVVGPDSLARQAQELVHSLAGFHQPDLDKAWSHQLKNEPGVMITYDRRWKIWQSSFFGMQTDVIPEAGLTVGNVMTYADAGVQFRIGQNLGVDYGVPRVRPSLSGTSWFDASRLNGPWGWYLFAGVQGRAVARNIFLDGNTFTDSPSVKKNILVGDFTAGASVFYSDWAKLDLTFTQRTKEFTTQQSMDRFGGASLSVSF